VLAIILTGAMRELFQLLATFDFFMSEEKQLRLLE